MQPYSRHQSLVLRYLIDNIDYRLLSINDLHETIYKKFREAGISVSFQKRDVQFNMRQPLDVHIQREDKRAVRINLAASQ